MDSYFVRREPSLSNFKPLPRPRWKRSFTELTGKLFPKYRHELSSLLLESYSEIGTFGHFYFSGGRRCLTHLNQMVNRAIGDAPAPLISREGISGVEFDTKGIYLASVTKQGCLTVHEFEALYCLTNRESPDLWGDEIKHEMHLPTNQPCDVVRWNRTNQDEVSCASMQSNKVLFFDIGYFTVEPVRSLVKKPKQGFLDGGLSDIAFTSNDNSRVLASSLDGALFIWDWRLSKWPCLELTTSHRSPLNSIQLSVEEQIVYGASEHGTIYAWDLRGGRSSVAFLNCNEVYHPPLISMKVASMLEKITPLKAQSKIFSRGIHSIGLDPSCPYQLAFHLDDGWSGVLDTHSFQVTHVHCPPPAWLNEVSPDFLFLRRKPSWLPLCSVYAVPSSFDGGIHLLDFYPDASAACHVDLNEEAHKKSEEKKGTCNKFVPLSHDVITACAAHPLNGTIIAGTKDSSLLMVSQKSQSCREEE